MRRNAAEDFYSRYVPCRPHYKFRRKVSPKLRNVCTNRKPWWPLQLVRGPAGASTTTGLTFHDEPVAAELDLHLRCAVLHHFYTTEQATSIARLTGHEQAGEQLPHGDHTVSPPRLCSQLCDFLDSQHVCPHSRDVTDDRDPT